MNGDNKLTSEDDPLYIMIHGIVDSVGDQIQLSKTKTL